MFTIKQINPNEGKGGPCWSPTTRVLSKILRNPYVGTSKFVSQVPVRLNPPRPPSFPFPNHIPQKLKAGTSTNDRVGACCGVQFGRALGDPLPNGSFTRFSLLPLLLAHTSAPVHSLLLPFNIFRHLSPMAAMGLDTSGSDQRYLAGSYSQWSWKRFTVWASASSNPRGWDTLFRFELQQVQLTPVESRLKQIFPRLQEDPEHHLR